MPRDLRVAQADHRTRINPEQKHIKVALKKCTEKTLSLYCSAVS